MLTQLDHNLIMSVKDELGKSQPSLHRYASTQEYPAEVCIKIELATKGALTANSISPDIFVPMPAHYLLAEKCVQYFKDSQIDCENVLVIAILNFLECQQSKLYNETMFQISKLDKNFVETRLAHKNDSSNI